MNDIGRWLIIGGVIMIVVGVVWQLAGRFLPLGRLPGDFVFERENIKVYFPIVTMIIVSIVLTVILNVFGRFLR